MNRKRKLMIIAVILIGVWMVSVIKSRPHHADVDITKGQTLLQAMDKIDVAEVNKKIQEREKEERMHLLETGELTINEMYEDCLITGDSITQGLYEYGVLSQNYVVADRGTEVTKVSNQKIEGHIAKAIAMKPRALFLAYGMNDLTAQRGKPEGFVKAYKEVIEELKEALPDTLICINSILPATKAVAENKTEYKSVPLFNQELKSLCEEEQVVFIDNTDLLDEEDYAPDGVHVTTQYYKKWVEHMAEVAGI